jgi:hypothetical protein
MDEVKIGKNLKETVVVSRRYCPAVCLDGRKGTSEIINRGRRHFNRARHTYDSKSLPVCHPPRSGSESSHKRLTMVQGNMALYVCKAFLVNLD